MLPPFLWIFLLSLVAVEGVWKVRFTIDHLQNDEQGSFVVEVHPEWAPNGAERFRALVEEDFYTDSRFFRVIRGAFAQFGIKGHPDIDAKWWSNTIPDDPVVQSNLPGMITYATAGANTRTTQLFVNIQDGSNLDKQGFAPFGKVVEGMDVIKRLYDGYGEMVPWNHYGADQNKIKDEGNSYLEQQFPRMSYISKTEILSTADGLSPIEARENPSSVIGKLKRRAQSN